MSFKVKLGRKIKAFFIKAKLHHLIEPLNDIFLQKLSYLSKLSQWHSKHPRPEFKRLDGDRYELYRYLLTQRHLDGEIDYVEFGVAAGHSLKWWVENNKNAASRFVGFDTFAGLPEDWGFLKRGTFTTEGRVPDIRDARCSFKVGMFQETLTAFLAAQSLARQTVVHLDADLYSSTLFVLSVLAPKLKPGDILIFDEFGVPTHEFRAFRDFVAAYQMKYKVVGVVNDYLQVAVELVKE